jgi:hypothetical protein
MTIHKLIGTLLLLVGSTGAIMQAADPFYVGTWKIVSAVPAPWDKVHALMSEAKTLDGKIVRIEAKRITGPHQVACAQPHFVVKDYPADMLFQGSFDELRRRDKSADPAKLAASIGFTKGPTWKTLETGCETEVDFHFIDPSTAAFGLNNVVYTLKKQ